MTRGGAPHLLGRVLLQEVIAFHGDFPLIREAAAELMQQSFDDAVIDEEFDGAVSRLQEAGNKRAFEVLQEKVHKLGVAGLSGEEKQQYLQALSARGRAG